MINKKIYAFDFDGTIVTNEFPSIGQPIMEVINMIHEVKKQGHYIILYTMREDQYLADALAFCRGWRIFFDAVNDNLPHMKEFYKNNPRKIFANYYIDDYNMGVSAINKDYAELKQQLEAEVKRLKQIVDVDNSLICPRKLICEETQTGWDLD